MYRPFHAEGLWSLFPIEDNLYLAAPAPGSTRKTMRRSALMEPANELSSRELDGKTPLLDIANRYELPLDQLYDYC